MPTINLFQFNGNPRVPVAIRQTLLETFEFCNEVLRPFYPRVVESVLARAKQKGFDTIVELGAGHAPLTRLMVEDPRFAGMKFVVCDLIPAEAEYESLQRRYADRVTAITEPVDFSQPRSWGPKSLLVLCAAIHHVPSSARGQVVKAFTDAAGGVMVFVPVRKHWLSLLLAMCMVFPALTLPVALLRRPGRLRRFLFCWILPLVPLMACWDGIGGSLRQWNEREWREAFTAQKIPAARSLQIMNWPNSQMIAW